MGGGGAHTGPVFLAGGESDTEVKVDYSHINMRLWWVERGGGVTVSTHV